jgi:hypothetical protein
MDKKEILWKNSGEIIQFMIEGVGIAQMVSNRISDYELGFSNNLLLSALSYFLLKIPAPPILSLF